MWVQPHDDIGQENTNSITEYNPSVVGTTRLPIYFTLLCSTARLPEAWTIYISQNRANKYRYIKYTDTITENTGY